MKRRNGLVGAALSVCLLAALAGTATAASSGSAGKATKVSCRTDLSIMIANGDTQVLPPAAQGDEYGTASCNKGLGGGVQRDVFTVPASGDTLAKYALYFGSGSLKGTYDLTPTSDTLGFLNSQWTGTLKVASGTGVFKGVTGTGTMKCSSADGIHTSCTDKLKLKGFAAG